ncbi:MAG TPA: DUF998 domain-containing protein [Acidimicrobiia bacterium]
MIGPAAFIGAWAIGGATTSGYSAFTDAISDLAAIHAPTQVLMTTGFVVDGLGLIAFGLALRDALEGRAWIAAVATGACTLAVAATPLGGWSGDAVHATFAGLGYAALVALPWLAVAPLTRRHRTRWAQTSRLTAIVSAACLLASTLGPLHGTFQRLGLTIGDAWIMAAASVVITSTVVNR